MAFTHKKDPSTDAIRIEGSLTVDDASDFRDFLLEALKASNDIVLDFERVTGADLTALELLCAAHKASVQKGGKFSVIGVPDSMKAVIDSAGYPRHMGCSVDKGKTCLWLERAGGAVKR